MNIKERIEAFAKLGDRMNSLLNDKGEDFVKLIKEEYLYNGWFTEENVIKAIGELSEQLTKANIENWLGSYNIVDYSPKTIGVVMAGNIPLVGFHDFMCVLLSGHKLFAKTSSDDERLLPFIADVLLNIEPRFKEYIIFTKEKLSKIDAVIATGSNNSSRYFEYYFSRFPHIIRKNRNSVAVLDNNTSREEMKSLGEDIFTYFGLGCRSVSKLFVPKEYDFTAFFESIYDFKGVIDNKKYANNYEYNRTIYLMNQEKLFDNNFILLKQDIGLSSPIGVLYYEYYDSKEVLNSRLKQDASQIQVIVGTEVPFGFAQKVKLSDYADGVDTFKFLINLD